MTIFDRNQLGLISGSVTRCRACVVLGVAAASATIVLGVRIEPVHVHALTCSTADDSDGDGLPDALELKLGTTADVVDSDGDGYWDGEEVARGSHPTRANSIPAPGAVALNIDAFQSDGQIHALTAVYFEDGDLRRHTFNVGMLVGDVPTQMPLERFRGAQPIVVLPGHDPSSRIVLVDPVLPTASISFTGSLSFFATLAAQGQYVAADAVNLTLVDGEIFEHVVLGYHTGLPDPQPNVGMGVGGVYKPLGSGSQTSNSTQGEICAQTTVIVGVIGSVITQEVVAADCVAGWDAYCSRGCAHTVGSTIKVIDPATLLGG